MVTKASNRTTINTRCTFNQKYNQKLSNTGYELRVYLIEGLTKMQNMGNVIYMITIQICDIHMSYVIYIYIYIYIYMIHKMHI